MLPRESTSQDGDKKAPAIERVKKLCVDVCDTLDRYSDLFKFIPSEDKYVTLITGTVTTIVQVRFLTVSLRVILCIAKSYSIFFAVGARIIVSI